MAKRHALPTQTPLRKVTLNSVVRSKEFLLGAFDAMSGRQPRESWELDARADGDINDWSYERGRQFAVWMRARGAALDINAMKPQRGRAPDTLIMLYAKARAEGAVL